MGIIIKNILIKAHHFINMIKRYYQLLQQVYFIITTEIPSIKFNLTFQIFFKAINNLIRPHELIFTLFVFIAYFKMTKLDALFLLIN